MELMDIGLIMGDQHQHQYKQTQGKQMMKQLER
jgi:hypothetical protein